MTKFLEFRSVALLLFLAALLSHAQAGSDLSLPNDANKIHVGMDCGSSGSRVCIYFYRKSPFDLQIAERDCVNVRPGLSSFADQPDQAGPSMKPLFDHVLSLNPPTGVKVYLAATAGLRALPDANAVDKIMKSVREYLEQNYAPQLQWADGYPRVLSGNEEGVFGWASVNHMLGILGKNADKTAGTLDMGGSSTQITFVPKYPSEVPSGFQFTFPYGDKEYKLYTHSFAGYGYNDARKSMLMEDNVIEPERESRPTVLIDPCGIQGYQGQANLDGKDIEVTGTGNWGDCTTRCKTLLSKDWPCVGLTGSTGRVTSGVSGGKNIIAPCFGANGDKVLFADPLNHNFYALSNFKDVETALGLPMETRISELLQRGKDLCSTPWSNLKSQHLDLDPEVLSTYCFGASYIYEVLHEGYHFPPDMPINFAKRLDTPDFKKTKISWTRGMILYEITKPKGHSTSGYGSTLVAGRMTEDDGGAASSNMGSSVLVVLCLLGFAAFAAAGLATWKGTEKLRTVVDKGMHKGIDKLRDGKEFATKKARFAAATGKRIAGKIHFPANLPFELPKVFAGSQYEDVDEETGMLRHDKGAKGAGMSSCLPVRGGKGYGSLSNRDVEATNGNDGADDKTKNTLGGFASFTKLWPQEGGDILRKSRSETSLEALQPNQDGFVEVEGNNSASSDAPVDQNETLKECIVCEGRVKMGVDGPCGLCLSRNDSKR